MTDWIKCSVELPKTKNGLSDPVIVWDGKEYNLARLDDIGDGDPQWSQEPYGDFLHGVTHWKAFGLAAEAA